MNYAKISYSDNNFFRTSAIAPRQEINAWRGDVDFLKWTQ